ncbi:potassium/sodium hyperpolarization-activated cyclic nucleotide-gated channel 3-like isoform X2 [Ascaphus truei]|uniref:potassium/sodium hyperpolarization-activated cyclic nucleotide-gated channel 3-like isoform X2 n=1 Tax=Ascaphus truei TaxID=8439 RepID=UPI003F5A5A0C
MEEEEDREEVVEHVPRRSLSLNEGFSVESASQPTPCLVELVSDSVRYIGQTTQRVMGPRTVKDPECSPSPVEHPMEELEGQPSSPVRRPVRRLDRLVSQDIMPVDQRLAKGPLSLPRGNLGSWASDRATSHENDIGMVICPKVSILDVSQDSAPQNTPPPVLAAGKFTEEQHIESLIQGVAGSVIEHFTYPLPHPHAVPEVSLSNPPRLQGRSDSLLDLTKCSIQEPDEEAASLYPDIPLEELSLLLDYDKLFHYDIDIIKDKQVEKLGKECLAAETDESQEPGTTNLQEVISDILRLKEKTGSVLCISQKEEEALLEHYILPTKQTESIIQPAEKPVLVRTKRRLTWELDEDEMQLLRSELQMQWEGPEDQQPKITKKEVIVVRPHSRNLNKYTMRLLGSKAAVCRESVFCILHPFSPARIYYIIFMFIFTIVNLLTTPIAMAFEDSTKFHITRLNVFNLFSDVLFLLDVGLNFRMGYISQEKLTVPYSEPTRNVSDVTNVILFARVLRLLRIARLARYIKEWEEVTNINMEAVEVITRILTMVLTLLLMCHWNGCIQFLIATFQGFPKSCWVVKENLINHWWGEQYSYSVLRAISQMMSIGYGTKEIPGDLTEMWIVMMSMICGSLGYGTVIAQVSAIVTNADQATKVYREKINQLTEYMASRKIPKDLCRRIMNYFDARYQGKWFDEMEILNNISEPLKEEILNHLCTSLVRKVPLFQYCDVNFLNTIVVHLKYELFQANDVIFKEGSYGDRMFFIEYGVVQVETAYFQKKLMDGDYFGEIALLRTKSLRTATVRALTLCSLFSLSSESFAEALKVYPGMRDMLVKAAAERLKMMQDCELAKQRESQDHSKDPSGTEESSVE